MAVVYEAIDRLTGARVALKVLDSIEGSSRTRFKREFRATQDVRHPSLVRLHELFEDGDRLFFTMDLIEGVDFLSFVRGGAASAIAIAQDTLPLAPAESREPPAPVPPSGTMNALACDEARLRDALAQLVSAVTVLHDHGLVHRDIKPSNILVTHGGELRLLDFGVIRDAVAASITRQVVGTVAYMAPEQAADGVVGPPADWYSVGTVIFEALTGALPFLGSSLDVLAHKQRYDAPAPRTLALGIPPDLDRLCESLLSRDPRGRPGGGAIALALGLGARPAREPAAARTAQRDFVGRIAERRWLRTRYERARRDGPVTIAVEGESGIGKTALVTQFLDELRADEPRLVVLHGRCYENESLAYKGVEGIVESLAAWLRRLPPEAAAALAPRHTAALTLQFPALAGIPALPATASPASPGDPHAARTQATRALRELLVRLADRYPLAIWLDDLQWIDADGALVLNELLQAPEAPPALFVVARTTGAMAGVAEPLPCTTEVLSLGPLGDDDARALATACAERDGFALDAPNSRRLAGEAQGHPILLRELVRCAVTRGLDPAGLALDDVLGARIAELDPASRALLELASVASRPLPLAVAAAGARLEIDRAIACASQLRIDRLLATRPSGAGVAVQPHHDRVRRCVLARLDPARAVAWHRAIAGALEAAESDDAETLAMHWSQAGDPPRAAPHAARAGHAAMRAFAFERAAALFQLAMSGTGDREARQPLLAAHGEALANAGRGPESARSFLAAAAAAPSPDAALALRHRAADQLLRSGHIDEGLDVLRDLLAAIGMRLPRSPRASLASLVVHRARLALRGLHHVPRSEAEVAPAVLRRLDVCYSVASGLGMVDLVRGADFQARCLLLALDAGEPGRLSRALAAEAIYTATESARSRRRAWPLIEAASALVDAADHPTTAGWVALARSIASLQDGRFADSLRFATTAEDIFGTRCPGAAWELARARAFTLWSLALLGRLHELADKVPELVRDSRERGDRFALMNLTAGPLHVLGLARDEAAEMRAQCQHDLASWAQGGFHFQHLCALFTAVAADLYEGLAGAATERVESAWRDIERSLLLRVQFFRLDLWALRGRAALAAAGRDGAAIHVRRVERAIARIERERMAWAMGHALALRAGLARLRGDVALASRLLERAEQAFAAAAMTAHAAACQLQRGGLRGRAGVDELGRGAARLAGEGVRRPDRFAATLVPLAVGS
jgi:hypothetical protein